MIHGLIAIMNICLPAPSPHSGLYQSPSSLWEASSAPSQWGCLSIALAGNVSEASYQPAEGDT